VSPDRVGDVLAGVNATLNATSAIALLVGFAAIRSRNVRAHRGAMLAALSASGLFLVFYVTRVMLTGTHEFAGQGIARTVYLAVLFTHMVLAVLVAPLVVRLVYLVRQRRFHDHASLARWTFPVWVYVSITGLAVYVLLYHVYGYA